VDAQTDRPGGGPTRQRRWDELVETAQRFARHLWDEATDRSRPGWPPAWLGFVAAGFVLLVIGFVVFPLATAVASAIAGWTDSGVNWLAAWNLTEVVTDPVRRYLNENAGVLPTTPDVLWVAWLSAGMVLLLLSLYGSTGARIGWAMFGVGSAAMVWSETTRPGEWLAVGVVAAWWSMFSLFAYRRRAPRDRIVVLDSLPAPRRAPTAEAHDDDLVLVDQAALRSALSLLDDLGRVLDTAAQAAMDTGAGAGAPPEAIRDRAGQVRDIRRQLYAHADDPDAGSGAGEWFRDLCWTLDAVPLLDAAQRYDH
jgi:hypothetical protein